MNGNRLVPLAVFVVGALGTGSVGIGFAAGLNAASQNLTSLRTCTVTATPLLTPAVADAAVQQALPVLNFGSGTSIDVTSASAANRRVYVRFDLSGCNPAIPSSANVRAATLRLSVTALPAGCRILDIFRVLSSWTEIGVTWNNQPFGTTLNNPVNTSRTDSFSVGAAAGCENQVTGYTTGAVVTADVAAYVTGTSNFGWMIRDDAENSLTARTSSFSTKELSALVQSPQLVVTYVTVP